jgi:peroxiredoxin
VDFVDRRQPAAEVKRAIIVGVVALSCAAMPACVDATPGAAVPSAGAMATDFTTRDVDGNTFRLSDNLGKKVILIDFWATWCQPCTAEFPHLQKMYDEQKAKGFVIVAVSMDGSDSIAEVPSFAHRNNVTFPVVLDEDSHIASIYNPRKSAPLSVLIDRQGHISTVREGYNPGDEELIYADVKKLVDAVATAPAPVAPTVAPTTPPAGTGGPSPAVPPPGTAPVPGKT